MILDDFDVFPFSRSKCFQAEAEHERRGLENPAAASAVGLASQDSTRPDCVSVTHIRYEKWYHTSIS